MEDYQVEAERLWDELAMLRVTPFTPQTAEGARKQRITKLAAALGAAYQEGVAAMRDAIQKHPRYPDHDVADEVAARLREEK